jgi:hypothetical protein
MVFVLLNKDCKLANEEGLKISEHLDFYLTNFVSKQRMNLE